MIDKQTSKQTRQTNKQTDRQADRQISKTNKRKDRQKEKNQQKHKNVDYLLRNCSSVKLSQRPVYPQGNHTSDTIPSSNENISVVATILPDNFKLSIM
jgi:hypothetical protein